MDGLYHSFLPAVLAIIAMICSSAGTFYCQTVSFPIMEEYSTTTMSQMEDDDDDDNKTLMVGIFQYQDPRSPHTCLSYDDIRYGVDDIEIDRNWKATKVISVLSLGMGGLVTAAAILVPCMVGSRRHDGSTTTTTMTMTPPTRRDRIWKLLGVFFLAFITVGQIATILLLRNSNICNFDRNPAMQFYNYGRDNEKGGDDGDDDNTTNLTKCNWATGLVLMVIAAVAFALAGIAILFVLPTPQPWVTEPPQTQHVTYQRTVHPDGTTTVEQVQVVVE